MQCIKQNSFKGGVVISSNVVINLKVGKLGPTVELEKTTEFKKKKNNVKSCTGFITPHLPYIIIQVGISSRTE